MQRKLQRNHAKGETGVIRRTKAELLSLLINPFPFGIPLTPFRQNPHTHSTKISRGRAILHGLPCRGCWPKSEQGAVLFREKRETGLLTTKRYRALSGICLANGHLPRRGKLIPRPHLAGTQTALPSVPVPTRVSFAAEPTSHSRCRAFP